MTPGFPAKRDKFLGASINKPVGFPDDGGIPGNPVVCFAKRDTDISSPVRDSKSLDVDVEDMKWPLNVLFSLLPPPPYVLKPGLGAII